MMKFLFLFLFFPLILACSEKEKAVVKYYKDIDMRTLTGMDEIQQTHLDYPYIQMGESQDKKVLTFFLNQRDSATYAFNKGKNYWVNFYQDNEPDNLYSYYEFVTNQHIIQIKYQGDPKEDSYRLIKLGVISDLEKFEYVFPTQDRLMTPPSELISSFPLEKAYIESKTTYQWLDGTWKKHEIISLKSSNKKIINDTCVDLGPNSLGWYLHCCFFVPSYECI